MRCEARCSVGPFLVPNSLPKEWKISVRRWSYFEGWPGHLFEVNGVQMELNGGSEISGLKFEVGSLRFET